MIMDERGDQEYQQETANKSPGRLYKQTDSSQTPGPNTALPHSVIPQMRLGIPDRVHIRSTAAGHETCDAHHHPQPDPEDDRATNSQDPAKPLG